MSAGWGRRSPWVPEIIARNVPGILGALSFPGNWASARRARRLQPKWPYAQSRRRFDYDKGRLVHPSLAVADERARDPALVLESTGFSLGYPGWNLLYYALVCSLPPREDIEVTIVETGTNRGYSTIVLAEAMKGAGVAGTVHTVDIDAAVVELAKENVAEAGHAERVVFHVGDSLEILTRLVREIPPIQFAFLDGNHDYHHVRREFGLVFPSVVAARGTVYFDNTSAGGVAGALRFIRRGYPGNLVEFPNCSWFPSGNAIWQP